MMHRTNLTFYSLGENMEKFTNKCKEITKHKYFKLSITNEALLNLVIDEKGNPRHIPPKHAIAITPSQYTTDLGVLFEVKKTDFKNKWFVDDSLHILVKHTGEVSFHHREDVIARHLEFGMTFYLL